MLLGVIVKVCSHLTSFSPFNADLFNGPFVYEKLTEKWTEWVSTQLAHLMVSLIWPVKLSKRRAKISGGSSMADHMQPNELD